MTNNKQVRVDPTFAKMLDEVSRERIKSDVERLMISPREVTRMMMNTNSLPAMVEELKSKPRKLR